MKAVKSKFRNVEYEYISISTEGLQLMTSDGTIVVVPINLKAPNALYKIQDIERAINLYERRNKKGKGTLPLDEMFDVQGLCYMFAIDKNGKIQHAKSSLHSTFGKYNKSLFPTIGDNETIFIIREDKSVIAVINGHYSILVKDGQVKKDISGAVSNNSYKLFKLLCAELTKCKEVREIFTKVM